MTPTSRAPHPPRAGASAAQPFHGRVESKYRSLPVISVEDLDIDEEQPAACITVINSRV